MLPFFLTLSKSSLLLSCVLLSCVQVLLQRQNIIVVFKSRRLESSNFKSFISLVQAAQAHPQKLWIGENPGKLP